MKIFILSYIYDEIVKDDMGGYRKVYELAQNLKKIGHEPTIFLPKLNYRSIPVRYVMIPTLDIPVIRPIIFNVRAFSTAVQSTRSSRCWLPNCALSILLPRSMGINATICG